MQEASCGSMMPAIIIYPFIYLLFSACCSSVQEASCGSTMPAIMIYSSFIVIHLFIYYLVPAAAACGRRPVAA
jgi:hypothetical protein